MASDASSSKNKPSKQRQDLENLLRRETLERGPLRQGRDYHLSTESVQEEPVPEQKKRGRPTDTPRGRYSFHLADEIKRKLDREYLEVQHQLYPTLDQIEKALFLETCLEVAFSHREEVKHRLLEKRQP